jgi:hypothetical protein
MKSQVVTVNRLPGAQEKAAHLFCPVGGDVKMMRLVAPWRKQQAEACRLDAPIEANWKELAYAGR